MQDAKQYLQGLPVDQISETVAKSSKFEQPKLISDRRCGELMMQVERNEKLSLQEYQVLSESLTVRGKPWSPFRNQEEEHLYELLDKAYDLDPLLPLKSQSQGNLDMVTKKIKQDKFYLEAEAETLSKLNMYNYSEEMVQLIASKLNQEKSQEQREFIKSKLELGNNEFSKFLAEGFSESPSLNQEQAIQQTLVKRGKSAKIVDSATLAGKFQPINRFKPANEADMMNHHNDRDLVTLEDYAMFRKAQMDEVLVRNEFNAVFDPLDQNHVTTSEPSDEEEEKKKEDKDDGSADEGKPKKKKDSKKEEEEDEQEELQKSEDDGEKVQLSPEAAADQQTRNLIENLAGEYMSTELSDNEDADRKNERAFERKIRDIRQAVREVRGTPNPSKDHNYDKISHDVPFDPIAKLEAKMLQRDVFDQDAVAEMFGQRHGKYFDSEEQARMRYNKVRLDRSQGSKAAYLAQLQFEYDDARAYRLRNQEMRVGIADNFKQLNNQLQTLKDRHRNLLRKMVENSTVNPEKQALPKKLFDFIAQEQEIESESKNAPLQFEHELIEQLRQGKTFTSEERDPKVYERELQFVSRSALTKPEAVKHFQTLFSIMENNGVEKTDAIRARLFEFATLTGAFDVANAQLAKLSTNPTFNQIDKEYLNRYYKTCLAVDSYDGIAYLTNYCEKHGIDISSSMDVNRFRATLDSYVNNDFNVSKIMVFAKFYVYYNKCKLSKALRSGHIEDLNSEEGHIKMAEAIFGENKSVVDMRSVLDYLVEHLGSQSLIDPLTREDAIWNLIDFYTRPEVIGASQKSFNDKVSPQTVANFLGNNLTKSNSLERIFRVALRYDKHSTASNQFVNQILKEINIHQAKFNRLPDSFTEKAIRDMYLKISNTEGKLSQPTKELLLHLLKASGQHKEVFDFAQRQDQSELTDYYKSEALLNMKLKKGTSYDAAVKSVLPRLQSACTLTQQTKALFRDQRPQEAIDLFRSGLKKIQQRVGSHDEIYENMYNKVFATQNGNISMDEFAALHLKTAITHARLQRDGFLVNTIKGIVQDKSYEEIESCTKLFTIMREEQSFMKKHGLNDEYAMNNTDVSWAKSLQLQKIRNRKDILIQLISEEDKQSLQDVVDVLQDGTMKIGNNLSGQQLQHMQELYQDMQVGEINKVMKRNQEFEVELMKLQERQKIAKPDYWRPLNEQEQKSEDEYRVAEGAGVDIGSFDEEYISDSAHGSDHISNSDGSESMEENAVAAPTDVKEPNEDDWDVEKEYKPTFGKYGIIRDFDNQRANTYEELLDAFLDEDYAGDREPPLWEEEQIHDRANRLARAKREVLENYSDQEMDQFHFNMYRDYMFNDPINASEESSEDVEGFAADAHNGNIFEAKHELLMALKERKSTILKESIELFNQIQSKTVKMAKLETDDVEKVSVAETLQRAEYLLNDHRSPIISGLLQTERYATYMPHQMNEYYESEQKDMYDDPIDIDMYERDNEKLENLSEGMHELRAIIISSNEKLKKALQEVLIKEQKPQVTNFGAVEKLYKKWQKDQTSKSLNAAQKVHFMKEAISLRFGTSMTQEAIPVYYALDLIQFGITQKCPDALRLGEHVLSSQGLKMPTELQHQVKAFMLEKTNNKAYSEAVARSGPINNSALYHVSSQREAGDTPIFSVDDPYWQDFMDRNTRREDKWRTPSILAWNHKRYGIIGEVIDVPKMQKEYERYKDF